MATNKEIDSDSSLDSDSDDDAEIEKLQNLKNKYKNDVSNL